MKYLLLLIFILSSSFTQNSSDIINRHIKDLEEKKVFEQQKIYEQQKDGLNFKDELLNINEDEKEENCIEISKINILNSTIFKNSDFNELIKPYLNKWNGNLKSDTFISFSMLLLLSVTFLSSLQTQQEIILLNNYEI